MATIKARLRPEEFLNYIQLLIFSKGAWDSDADHTGLVEARQQAAIEPNPQPLHALEGQVAACIGHDVLAHWDKSPAPSLSSAAGPTFSLRLGWRMRSQAPFLGANFTFIPIVNRSCHVARPRNTSVNLH
jgi:hypothetical protein